MFAKSEPGFEMNPFPTEIWMHIIEPSLVQRDWLGLSCTCPFFRVLAQASLYRDIYVPRFLGIAVDWKITAFVRSLTQQPELCLLPHRLGLATSSARDRVPPDTFLSNPILIQIASFTNLRRLELDNFCIDSTLFSAIYLHPRLKFTLPRVLKELTIWRPRTMEACRAAPISMAKTLSSTRLKTMARKLNKLDLAQVNSSISSQIISFLTVTPQLRSLTLDCRSLTGSADTAQGLADLPGPAIPLLEVFSGSVSLGGIFVRGRPVMPCISARYMIPQMRPSFPYGFRPCL
jgi:hypothetical protein